MCATLYETVLPLLIPMIEEPTRFRDLWEQEDAQLTASEQAIADGSVTIDEVDGHALAIVTVTQFRSRQLPKRVDLEPLKDELEALETGAATWTASKASSLTPTLRSTTDSSLTRQVVSAALIGHLQTAPTAWDLHQTDS